MSYNGIGVELTEDYARSRSVAGQVTGNGV